MDKFIRTWPKYLKWARTLWNSSDEGHLGAIVLLRDGMAYHGCAGFSLKEAYRIMRAEELTPA